MKDVIIVATPDNMSAADELAQHLNVELAPIYVNQFPDGEIKIRATKAASRTIVFHRLDHPRGKLSPLVFAASALRDLGAREIVLVAPYLCYMRQDKAFETGEAVSQRVIANLLSQWVDHIVTVEPHLHRTKNLASLFPEIKVTTLSAAPLLATLIGHSASKSNTILIGPDVEAHSWTEKVAANADIPFVILTKERYGDRNVEITISDSAEISTKQAFIIDDIVSSGATLCAAAAVLRQRGVSRIEALSVHALCGDSDLKRIKDSGIARLQSTDSIPHQTNAISVIPMLAKALL